MMTLGTTTEIELWKQCFLAGIRAGLPYVSAKDNADMFILYYRDRTEGATF